MPFSPFMLPCRICSCTLGSSFDYTFPASGLMHRPSMQLIPSFCLPIGYAWVSTETSQPQQVILDLGIPGLLLLDECPCMVLPCPDKLSKVSQPRDSKDVLPIRYLEHSFQLRRTPVHRNFSEVHGGNSLVDFVEPCHNMRSLSLVARLPCRRVKGNHTENK